MQIYVGKNGQQLGPFSLEEINRKLADGTFVGSDLAWYEGAAGWAPLSGVAGVVIPPPAARTPLPTPAPQPTPTPVLPSPVSVRPNASIVQPPRSRTKVLAVVSWVLLGITLIVSFIPFVGCGAWGLVWPVAAATIIMGIIIVVRGAAAQGIFIILAAIVMIPIGLFAPVFTTALAVGAVERKQETQILANLRQIDAAKTSWAAETRAAAGAPVTMANLTSQLAGKEVKSVIDETYDPMPIGQAATATLPANKTLGTFSGGDVVTAASLEKALAHSSTFSWNAKRSTTNTFFSATPTPSISPQVSATPSITGSPSPGPSLAPSVSPRSSTPPHSLISPRQSVEPDDSPSSRQSPSGKFAPRKGPRQNPSPPDEKPDSEKSGGLKQGRQFPRESPGATPEKSPDDDDD